MTESEWLADTDGRQLRIIEEVASVRKLRLIAATVVRQAQSSPENEDAKRCDDIIEAVADHPRSWEELELELWDRPGNWRFTHILPPGDPTGVAKALRKLVAFNLGGPVQDLRGLIHEVVGNPFRPVVCDPVWRTSTALALAQQMYDSRDFNPMPILADALQDAGCDNDVILNHCRDVNTTHVRGCWVIDLVLGKS